MSIKERLEHAESEASEQQLQLTFSV